MEIGRFTLTLETRSEDVKNEIWEKFDFQSKLGKKSIFHKIKSP